jgi:MoaA/NifB/PqqE/SkfB family radical SAM enzyme
MYKLENINSIHLELTNKCQAKCPMCPRRIHGGMLNPLVNLSEITLTQFKEWFPVEFIKKLNRINLCGNLGDPIIAKDCLDIVEYIRLENPTTTLSMHTNGGARTANFWKGLAKAGVRIVFGIDGLADTHSIYRIGTDYNNVIENAKNFIEAGGYAEWHMLCFEHNEHQIDECRNISVSLGFKGFITKHTSRFVEDKFHVLDESGKTVNILKPTKHSRNTTIKIKNMSAVAPTHIHCKAAKSTEIYVSADGVVTPCCWMDLSWGIPHWPKRIDYMDRIGIYPNLNKNTIVEIFDSGYFEKIKNTWSDTPLIQCADQCGLVDKLGEQFAN